MVIACCGSIEIGNDVLTADRVYIGDTFHEYRDVRRPVIAQGLGDPRPVRIDDGSFLGVNSAILPGVTMGEGGYVAANAVVTRMCLTIRWSSGTPRAWCGAGTARSGSTSRRPG